MSVLPYFPFSDAGFTMTLGTQALGARPIIEVDVPHYHAELHLKNAILRDDDGYYLHAPLDTLPMQWEVVALLLRDLAAHSPEHFALTVRGDAWTWQNALLDSETTFCLGDATTLPLPPLDWVGRQVQEDLLLMSGDAARGFPLVAGQLCFANAWSLADKLGKSFLGIHDEVPLFAAQIGRSSNLLMERLKVDRPVWRVNWSIKTASGLNHSLRLHAEVARTKHGITPENAGERCLVRLERQGLTRLPQTGAILFTIHTYQASVAAVAADPQQARWLHAVLSTTPAETLEYKGMALFNDALVAYLVRSQESGGRAEAMTPWLVGR